jgi:hypothetical protein
VKEWKSGMEICVHCPDGYLGTLPAQDPAGADEIIELLGYSEFSKREAANVLISAIMPSLTKSPSSALTICVM